MKLSIVIPVYNVEKYLIKCLDSISNQTYKNWECIIIDDGSTDNSGIICDDYASKHDNFHVYHKQNGGVSSARNMGIEKAKGDWIGFIDPDDYIDKQYYDILMSCVKAHPDYVPASAKIRFCEGETPIAIPIDRPRLRELDRLPGAVFRSLFNRESLVKSNVRFRPISNFEDTIFVIEYAAAYKAKGTLFCDASYFHLCGRNNSICGIKEDNHGSNTRFVKSLPYICDCLIECKQKGYDKVYLNNIARRINETVELIIKR